MDDEIARRFAALEQRVAALEPPRTRTAAGDSLGLLDRLRGPADPSSPTSPGGPAGADAPTGAVTYAGVAGFGGHEYLWVKEHRVGALAAADWGASAATLECLGSPARLRLLATLVGTSRTRTQLQDVLGETSTGHLYHHLRALQAAGLLVQPRRGEYELAPNAVVPLLVILAAARDLTTPTADDE